MSNQRRCGQAIDAGGGIAGRFSAESPGGERVSEAAHELLRRELVRVVSRTKVLRYDRGLRTRGAGL